MSVCRLLPALGLVISFSYSAPAMADFSCSRCQDWVRVPKSVGYFHDEHALLCGNCKNVDCGKDAAELRARYARVLGTLDEHTAALPGLIQKRDALRAMKPGLSQEEATRLKSLEGSVRFLEGLIKGDKEALKGIIQSWAELKFVCPNIGNLTGGERDKKPVNPDFKSDQGRENLLAHATALRDLAGDQDHKGDQWTVVCSVLPAPSAGAGIGIAEVGVQFDLASMCTESNTLDYKTQIRALVRMAEELEKLAKDPPSPAYEYVAEPAFDGVHRAADTDSTMHRANVSLHRCAALIEAYRVSFERYQGAVAAKDAGSAQRQIDAMVRYARLASDEAARSAAIWDRFERLYLVAFDARFQQLEKEGIDWKEAFRKKQQQLKADGLPPERRRVLVDAGYEPKEIDEMVARLLATTPEEFKARIDEERSAKPDVKTNPADAPHGAALASMRYHAHIVNGQVSGARIELSGASDDALPEWWVEASGTPARLDPQQLNRTSTSTALLPGEYDVYIRQSDSGGPSERPTALRIATRVRVESGKPSIVKLDSGIKIEPAPRLGKPHAWFVTPSSGPATTTLSRLRGPGTIWLPPGGYDVYWVHADAASAAVLVARDVQVRAGAVAKVPVGSVAVKIDVPGWVPPRRPDGWWGLALSGDVAERRIAFSAKEDTLVVPPGRYDVVWVQDSRHRQQALVIADGIDVAADRDMTVGVNSGVHLETAPWAPKLDPDSGWWGAVVSGGNPTYERINWSSVEDRILLPPGTYDLYSVLDHAHRDLPVLLARDVEVKARVISTVPVTSGIAIKPIGEAKLSGSAAWWGVVRSGEKPEARLHFSSRPSDPLVLPPGTYDIVCKLSDRAEPTVIARGVVVKKRTLNEVPVKLDTPAP